MFYLTEGYTGEGLVYISQESRVIITDFRYTEQAERQAPDFRVEMTGKGRNHNQILAELVKAEQITELRAETNYLSVDAFEAMRGTVGEEISYVPLNKAPQQLRQIKTPAEIVAIRKACDITSEAFSAILPKIRPGMTEKELQKQRDHEEDLQRLRGFRPLDDTFMRVLFRDNLPLAEYVLRIIIGKEDLKLTREETQKDLVRLVGARGLSSIILSN
jgi:Xaa-Pro aminopeptidase